MPAPARIAAVTALTAGLLTAASPASAAPAQPEGKIVVFVTEGAEVSLAGTELREYPPSSACQAFPAGAHVVANQSTGRLLFFADPFCLTPAPPPFNFIPPGHGAHVSPTGGFRVG
ncbi:hypothetical protein BJF79_23140 [Actinomadura sp. CNU-125]|uniref:hypothetical protein n=1 Tax=Actinomadura sp. CNU-125 TaxID=1904961 RepID=UPI00095B4E21|nr:hypothetical protein [Actinomadura sp. CNU-125]OLT11924.1 hypothetical protein BJF79_23140 [Actinomadura sp. CNU-125]